MNINRFSIVRKKYHIYASWQGGSECWDNLLTTRRIKDPAAWYHFVYVYDTAASAADRMRIYVNGVEETVFSNRYKPNFKSR